MKMIDTVAPMLNQKNYKVTNHNRFTPPTDGLFERSQIHGAFQGFHQNPLKDAPYSPRLDIYARKRGRELEASLKSEFSAPKLLYSNNVDEVCEGDFDRVVDKWQERLEGMDVLARKEGLEEAPVSIVHFSKNIPLSGGYTSSLAIAEFAKLDLNGKLKIRQTDYGNDGRLLRFRCGTYEIVFYDKMHDIQLPTTTAFDKDAPPQQLSLLESYKPGRIPELLRFEVRFTKKQKLNSMLKELGFKENPTFKDIFRKDVSQAVLQHYWNFIGTEKYAFLLKPEKEPDQLLEAILRGSETEKGVMAAKNGFVLLGMNSFVRKYGIRALKSKIHAHCSRRTWDRLKPNLEVLNKISKNNQPFGFVKDVELALNEFKPFRVKEVA